MRIRRKKHTVTRMEACSELLLTNPEEYKGKFKSLFDKEFICLEIGCGKGSFITQIAKQRPESLFIAMEKVPDVIIMAMEKVKQEGLSNVRFIHDDASKIPLFFEKDELSEVFINFCDPWHKKRHAKRRLTYRSFISVYQSILKENGIISFKTDNRNLFNFSIVEMQICGLILNDITYDLHNSEYMSSNIITEYEKNFSEQGYPIHRLVGQVSKDLIKKPIDEDSIKLTGSIEPI